MTEDDARAAIAAISDREAIDKLEAFAAMVLAENRHQNLISRASEPHLWERHILDSLQLATLAEPSAGPWVDIGTGGGFPGVVVATVVPTPVILVEPRQKRADFLQRAVEALNLDHVIVRSSKVERTSDLLASVISARAVAPIDALFSSARHLAAADTQWVLPRGMHWHADLAAAKMGWKALFHVEHSVTDAEARIIMATQVVRR